MARLTNRSWNEDGEARVELLGKSDSNFLLAISTLVSRREQRLLVPEQSLNDLGIPYS